MIAQGIQGTRVQTYQRYNLLFNQALQWVVFTYQAIAMIVFVASLFIATHWMQRPFLGAFYEHTMVFNGTGPTASSPEWGLFEQVVLGDQLIAINATPVKNDADVQSVLQNFFPGETVTLTVRSENGQERDLDIFLHPFSSSSRFTQFIIPSILSFIFLVVSLWIFGLRRNEPAGRSFSFFTSSLALFTGIYFNLFTTPEFKRLLFLYLYMSWGGIFR